MSDLEKRVKMLEKQIEKLTKPKKKPSEYNTYMKEAVKKLKESNPKKYAGKAGHQLAFSEAASKWSLKKKGK